MREILNKAITILSSVKWYGSATVFYNVDNENTITKGDVSNAFVQRTFGEAETIVLLKAKNNMLSVKQIIVPKVTLRMLSLFENDQTNVFLEVDPGMQYHSIVYKDIKNAADLNDYDNDQYIADLLQEMEVKPENVFIEP